jgi:toxin ParE1/3/4
MSEPRLTEQAEADLDEAWAYLATKNRRAADRLIDAIWDAARRHARFPESGRSREEYAANLRSFVVSPFVVFYRPVEDTIEVIRVLHGRRDIRRIMRKNRDDPTP